MAAARWRFTLLLGTALALTACGDANDNPTQSASEVAVPAVVSVPAPLPMAMTDPPLVAPEPVPPPTPTPAAIPQAVSPLPVPPVAAETATPPGAAPAATPLETVLARVAAADPIAGEALAAQCGICHSFGDGEGTRLGPSLFAIVGAPIARVPSFSYSPALRALAVAEGTWTLERLDAFIADPALLAPGTRMGFAGMPDPAQRANVLAWLRTLSPTAVPAGGPLEQARAAGAAAGLVPIVFDGPQLQRGRDFFNQHCARCHGPDLMGLVDMREFGEAPELVGDRFLVRWLGRPVSDLHALLAGDTRENYHGGFTAERYANLIAYLAERNGMTVGDRALPEDEMAQRNIGFYQ